MPRGDPGRISFARVSLRTLQPPLDFQLEPYLRRSVLPGTAVTRFGRTWRVSKTTERRALRGRMGFEKFGGVADLWDEKLQDFAEVTVRDGMASPFALDLVTGRLAFQLRREIKPWSFTGNFQALLNVAASARNLGVRWRVDHEVRGETWEHFLERVDRVNHLDVTVRRPNPHYGDRDEVEELIELGNLATARLILDAKKDDLEGIDIGAPLIAQVLEHSEQYGKKTAVAEFEDPIGGTDTARWRSDVEGAPLIGSLAVDAQSGEVDPDDLEVELEARSREALSGGDDQ